MTVRPSHVAVMSLCQIITLVQGSGQQHISCAEVTRPTASVSGRARTRHPQSRVCAQEAGSLARGGRTTTKSSSRSMMELLHARLVCMELRRASSSGSTKPCASSSIIAKK